MFQISAGKLLHPRSVDVREGGVPIRRVVAAGFPRMGHCGSAALAAAIPEPAMPCKQFRVQAFQPLSPFNRVAPENRARDCRDDGGLGDARRCRCGAGAPNFRSRKIAFVDLMEDDVRHHAVRPLSGHERFKLRPSSVDIECGKSQSGERAVPIPLVGIKPVRRNGVGAAIVPAHDGARVDVEISLQHR